MRKKALAPRHLSRTGQLVAIKSIPQANGFQKVVLLETFFDFFSTLFRSPYFLKHLKLGGIARGSKGCFRRGSVLAFTGSWRGEPTLARNNIATSIKLPAHPEILHRYRIWSHSVPYGCFFWSAFQTRFFWHTIANMIIQFSQDLLRTRYSSWGRVLHSPDSWIR